MLSPLTAALLASFCWGSAWFFSARVSREAGSLNALFLFQLLGVPLLLFAFPIRPPLEQEPQWGMFLVLAAVACFGMGLFFQAMRVGNLALVTPLSLASPVIAAAASLLVLREPITTPQAIGISAVFAGGALLSLARGEGTTRLLAGVPHAAGAACIMGAYLFFAAGVARTSGWYWTSLGIRLGMVLWLAPFVLPGARVWLKRFPRKFWQSAAIAGGLDVTAFSLYNFAVTKAELWYTAAIVTSQSLVTVLLAALFLRERLNPRQWAGLILVLLGLTAVQAFG